MRQHRDFLRIWAGQGISNVGDGVSRIAVLWWARQATGSDVIVVFVALATVVPTLAAAPLAGWLVDRYPRRTLMLLSDLVRCCVAAALALAVVSESLTTGLVVALSAAAAVAGAVFDPSLLASVTLLVPPEHRVRANSMLGVSGALAGIVGPAIGGVLIGVAGTGAALWFDAVTFLVSFGFVAVSRVPRPVATAGAEADGGLAAGFRLVRADRAVRDLVVVTAGLNLCVAPVAVLIVGLAAGPLDLGGGGYGLLEAAVPLGLVGGFLFAPRVARSTRAALFALLLTGGGIAIAGAIPSAWWAGAAFVFAGLGVGVANTIIPSRFQESVDPGVQGRVFSLVGALSQAGRPIGLLLTAPLAAMVGVRAALAVCGVALAGVAWAGRRGLAAVNTIPETVSIAVAAAARDAEFDECHG